MYPLSTVTEWMYVNENVWAWCDSEVTESEIVAATEGLNPNKSPGGDGLTSEFYKDFKE